MLNVSRLRVLREVIRQGSFSGAAAALSYTQSAVSQAVATLEAETGATLVERDRKGIRPTAAGQALIEHVDAILSRLDAAKADLDAILGLRGGRLQMASFPTAGATLMPPAIAAFRAEFPDVELSLIEGEPEEIAPRLGQGELDLALLFEFHGSGERLAPGLKVTELLEDPLHVALPKDHALASRDMLTLEDLRDDAWIQTSVHSPCARHVVHCCRAAGFEPIVSFESDDYQTVQGLVAAGVGVALIPELALRSAKREDIVTRELHPESPQRRVVVATRRGKGVLPAAQAMVATLKRVATTASAT